MTKFKNNLLTLCVLLVIIGAECKRFGGSTSSRGGGWSRPSSSGSHSSWGSHSSSSGGNQNSHSSSGSNYGWSRPSPNTGSSSWSRPNTNTGSNTGSNFGWNTQTHSNPGGSNSGWQKPASSGTQTGSGTNYGWQKPASPQTGGTQTGSGTNYGWQKPATGGTQTHANPPQTGFKPPNTNPAGTHTAGTQSHANPSQTGFKPPNSGSAQTGGTNYGFQKPNTNPTGTQTGTSYGWKKPDNAPQGTSINSNIGKTSQTHVNNPYSGSGSNYHSNAPSANIGPKGYPVQQGSQKYYTGYNNGYQQGYSHGYQNSYNKPTAHPSSYGFNQHYYPSQNNYGYPGQGIFGGPGGPSYGGMSVFGGNGHYGYPSSGSWGSPSYGTGSSTGSALKGALVGAVAGYYINSLVHRATAPTNYWGYPGTGYGSQYGHVTVDRRTIITNNYNNQTTGGSGKDDSIPGHWVQCVAFDPITQTTLLNPNCTCSVTTQTDPATNITSSLHNCTTAHGVTVTEKTPVGLSGRYAPDIETFDSRYATPKLGTPEKYVNGSNQNFVMDQKEQQKKEFYSQLEKIVNMGRFTS